MISSSAESQTAQDISDRQSQAVSRDGAYGDTERKSRSEAEQVYILQRHGTIPPKSFHSFATLVLLATGRVICSLMKPFSRSHKLTTHASVNAPRFWAVLIGIDAYEHNRLHGCVSDVSLMKEFLTNDLGVPEGRIQCLLGPNDPNPGDPKSTPTPSRANIVDMLYGLVHNTEIHQGDNIIVYYAGHGASYRCQTHSSKTKKCSDCLPPIEALCPLDRDTLDDAGNWIPDISDREINNLFKHVSLVKGNKITFIADCCYGGGTSRDSQEPRSRFIRTTKKASLHDMLHVADERWKFSGDASNYQSVSSKNWQPDMTSHLLLAACEDYETAKEELGKNGFRGVFTWALVGALRSSDWKKKTTYVDLVKLLKKSISGQTPLVAGNWKEHRPFYQAA